MLRVLHSAPSARGNKYCSDDVPSMSMFHAFLRFASRMHALKKRTVAQTLYGMDRCSRVGPVGSRLLVLRRQWLEVPTFENATFIEKPLLFPLDDDLFMLLERVAS